MPDVFDAAFTTPMTRRRLIKQVAAAGAATMAAGALPALARAASGDFTSFNAIGPSSADLLQVPEGYVVDVIAKWGDEFAPGMRFGYNCDYSTFFPLKSNGSEGLMWVNHEYIVPFFTSDWPNTPAQNATWDPRGAHASLMAQEKYEVGGSIVHIRRAKNGPWEIVYGSPYSRRFTADGPEIGYDGPVASAPSLLPTGGKVAGTLANCSGAQTPWGTVLTCEENFQSFGLKRGVPLVFSNGWIKDDGSTEEEVNYYIGEPGMNIDGVAVTDRWPFYGYVVEIDPLTGDAVKHTSLGRIHHENVGIRIARGRKVVCYTGDDAPASDGMFFKFVSASPYTPGMSREDAMKLLAEGQLYVARWLPSSNPQTNETDSGTGEWIPLDMTDPEACAFTTRWVEQNIVTPNGYALNQFRVPRAEDCEVVKNHDRRVLISLTSARGRPAPSHPAAYGVVRLLEEDSNDGDGLTFRWVDLLEGGPESGFSNPDNMAFLTANDLLVVTDISTLSIGTPNFAFHGNNAAFYVPLTGPNANVAFRFANAPVEAELTGPTYNNLQRTLFLNVQHPGEESQARGGVVGDPSTFTSWWPGGNKTAGTGTPGKPRPSLVAIRKV